MLLLFKKSFKQDNLFNETAKAKVSTFCFKNIGLQILVWYRNQSERHFKQFPSALFEIITNLTLNLLSRIKGVAFIVYLSHH